MKSRWLLHFVYRGLSHLLTKTCCFLVNVTLLTFYLTAKCKLVANNLDVRTNGISTSFLQKTVQLLLIAYFEKLASWSSRWVHVYKTVSFSVVESWLYIYRLFQNNSIPPDKQKKHFSFLQLIFARKFFLFKAKVWSSCRYSVTPNVFHCKQKQSLIQENFVLFLWLTFAYRKICCLRVLSWDSLIIRIFSKFFVFVNKTSINDKVQVFLQEKM